MAGYGLATSLSGCQRVVVQVEARGGVVADTTTYGDLRGAVGLHDWFQTSARLRATVAFGLSACDRPVGRDCCCCCCSCDSDWLV